MREFIRGIVHSLEAGQDVQLVSVIESGGSTPRGAGAMMAVFPDGSISGTVGGGNVEYEAVNLAKTLLLRKENAIRKFRFVQGDAASLGMVCGGDVTIHFQHLAAENAEQIRLLRELLTATGENTNLWLVRKFREEQVLEMGLGDRSGYRHLKETPPSDLLQNKPCWQGNWFALPVVRAGRVYIFGGGHVSQALVPAVAAVGFRPVVYDDRMEFARKELFPQAEETICASFAQVNDHVTITPDDYVVIMTRGHQADTEVLTQVLRSGANYLGCIGSKRKLAACREALLKAGFTEEEYRRLHAPIGLAIGAETPAEIAVSVTAELIAVRAGLER